MSEIDAIRALERQLIAIQAGEAPAESIDAMDRHWLIARSRSVRSAAIRDALGRIGRLPLRFWRRVRSVAIAPVEETSAGHPGR